MSAFGVPLIYPRGHINLTSRWMLSQLIWWRVAEILVALTTKSS